MSAKPLRWWYLGPMLDHLPNPTSFLGVAVLLCGLVFAGAVGVLACFVSWLR